MRPMGIPIEDEEFRKLAQKVAELAGESEAEAVRQSLRERRDRLESQAAPESEGRRPRTEKDFRRFMEEKIWPLIPEEHRGRPPMTKVEREEILGYGPEGF